MKIILIEQPGFERHNFTVTITLSDGNSFVMETGDVYLQNPDEEQE